MSKENTQLDESTASEDNSAACQWEAKEGEPEEKSSKQWSRLMDVPTLMLGGMGKVTLASLSLMQPAGWVSCAAAKHKQAPQAYQPPPGGREKTMACAMVIMAVPSHS